MAAKAKVIIIDKTDNVGVALSEPVFQSETLLVDGRQITARTEIPVGHKIAVEDIPAGGAVRKFGEVIGRAKTDILAGDWVHVHNVEDITEQLAIEELERRKKL